MKNHSILLLIALLITPLSLPAVDSAPTHPLFNVPEYLGHLRFLAHDLLEGRGTGDRGAALAAAYIAAQFETLGLQPYSEEHGYLQPVALRAFKSDYSTVRVVLKDMRGREFQVEPLSETCIGSEQEIERISLEEDLLFVGYGIQAPEFRWDDFKGVDVAGKVLVALVNDPDHEKTGFGDESLTYYGRWSYKQEMARRRGAKGIILIHHDREATYGWPVVRNSWAGERMLLEDQADQLLLLQAWISHQALDRALQGSGLDYVELKKRADNRRFKPFKLPLRLAAEFSQQYRRALCHNVIGVIPGTDPELSGEAVIYTGHFDHLGIGLPDEKGDVIYNGASDNASGTAALLCLARAFMQAPEKPRRTIMFVPVTGEELGLLGSTYFVENPPLPLEKIAVVLNKDVMNHFGKREGFSAFPLEYSSALPEVESLTARLGLRLFTRTADPAGGSFRSDHFPFAARGVPAMSIGFRGRFTERSDEELRAAREQIGYTYHQPNDEIHPAWVYDGVLQELDLLYTLGRHWADGAVKPRLTIDKNNPYWATRIWYGLQ